MCVISVVFSWCNSNLRVKGPFDLQTSQYRTVERHLQHGTTTTEWCAKVSSSLVPSLGVAWRARGSLASTWEFPTLLHWFNAERENESEEGEGREEVLQKRRRRRQAFHLIGQIASATQFRERLLLDSTHHVRFAMRVWAVRASWVDLAMRVTFRDSFGMRKVIPDPENLG